MSGSGGLKISLAAWSLHRTFFAREIDQLGMLEACAEMGISGFELVNTFFLSPQYAYLRHMKRRAKEKVTIAATNATGSKKAATAPTLTKLMSLERVDVLMHTPFG